MPIPTYNSGYPQDGSSLGQSKAQIRANIDGTYQTLAIDHIDNNGNPGAKPAGYHKVIHIVPQVSNPGAIAGYGQLFSKTVSSVISDTALFWETGTGLVSQLTMNITPRSNTRGYTFLPGGILLQWGIISSPASGDNAVLFNAASGINFPTACFNVQISVERSAANIDMIVIKTGSISSSGFTAIAPTGGSTNIYWTAIGN